jgi:hypothetical protein
LAIGVRSKNKNNDKTPEKEGYNDTQKAIQEYAGLVVSKEGSYKIPIGKITGSSI